MTLRPPSVDVLATRIDSGMLPRSLLIEVARRAIDVSKDGGGNAEEIGRREARRLGRMRPGPVVNATGVLLHTNLGRATLGVNAVAAAAEASRAPGAIEFDLDSGSRGPRGAYLRSLLQSLTGAEDAAVVNNNAAALFLTLAAISWGRETIVSRGELIEIGGSFRLPDLMAASGAVLVEVGTTNRTRLDDYRRACGADTAMLLKVHPANYRIEGFSEEASFAALGLLAKERGVPLVADVGSGLLDVRAPWIDGPPPAWLAEEPAVRQTLDDGADLVMFSGDKLLGGPQAGIIVGRGDLITAIARHPIARAVRLDGATIASLGATLEAYASGRAAALPFWRQATLPASALQERLTVLVRKAGISATIIADQSLPGAGSVPGRGIPGPVLAIPSAPNDAWTGLLSAEPPIVARRTEGGLVVDLRAVDPGDDGHIAETLSTTCR